MRVEGYEHATGAHCGSTSLRNLAAHYDWGFDEPACFGLASGLGFSFFDLPVEPWRMFVGRPLWLERAFFDTLEVPHTDTEGDDWPTAWDDVRERLDSGDPVMVFTDLYYLDYYDTDTHFAPHSLLVVGYESEEADSRDEATGVALVSDSEFEDVQRLPLDSFRDAWSSKHTVPLSNRWLAVEGNPRRNPEPAARDAIRDTCRYMLDPDEAARPTPPYGHHGVAGIRAFADDLPSFHALEDPRWTVRFAYQNVERRGTGGGAFRGLYAPFLDRATDCLDLDPSFSERMHAIADDWTALAGTLRGASETDEGDTAEFRSLCETASERVHAVADAEAALYRDLLAALGEG